MTLGEMTDTGKTMNPQHFVSEPADIDRTGSESELIWKSEFKSRIIFG